MSTSPPIVVGIDYTDRITSAVHWLRATFAPESELILVRAVETEPIPIYLRRRFANNVDWIRQDTAIAHRQLEAYTAGLGVDRVTMVAIPGRPDTVLLEAARSHNADTIVVGPHRDVSRPWRRLGSATERLLRTSHLPVLVIHEDTAPTLTRILVAADDARVTRTVVARAVAIADRFDAKLSLVHVISPAAYNHVLSMSAAGVDVGPGAAAAVQDEMNREAARWLDEIAASAPSRKADVEITHGKPAEEILAVADRIAADLIVIGQYGAGRVMPAFLGSVLGSVTHDARCPVLVVGDRPAKAVDRSRVRRAGQRSTQRVDPTR